MENNSFTFGKYNSLKDWNIKVNAYDFLTPQKRANKIMIPGLSGTYDYGAEEWEEKTLRIFCEWKNNNSERLPKQTMREIAYWLSKKGKLTLWDEPDKYYIAELYNPAEITDLAQTNIKQFELEFICEPFAYTEPKIQTIDIGPNTIKYNGTQKAPCLITIKNTGETDIKNLIITLTKGVD